jgi:NADH:ubiquinone oxidoreductase subunit F (NADH-binding)/(2Fe-2S) ferredoxin/NAD-dependent dihydropyrimidine dehydrogenase PreA subunit
MNRLSLQSLRAWRERARRETALDGAAAAEPQAIVGLGTCGVAAGAEETYRAIVEALAAAGLPSVRVRRAGCMGLCYAEPVVEVCVPGQPRALYTRVDAGTGRLLVQRHLVDGRPLESHLYERTEGRPAPSGDGLDAFPKQLRIVLRNCGRIDPDRIEEYVARDGYEALAKALFEMTPEEILREIEKSGLRGRGGAGFSTHRKWLFSRNAAADCKYVVCNADEGDPGAYMDRSTLEGDPHSVLEAMAIAGRTVGASQGYVYVRAEYPLAIRRLETAIEQARACGLLGRDILGSGFDFDVELRYGAGAFVCGEETALLASIEGHRGMPRPRPPFPAVRGLWGRPTVINNVETLANIPVILLKGGDWFGNIGTATSKGTKVFALTGKVNRSGLIEVPMGTTLREIVFDIGGGIRDGRRFKAAQTGGPSGGVIPEEYLDTPLDYENLAKLGTIMGSGGLIVMDDTDCMVDVARFYLQFTVEESCGKCAPCRVGGRTLYDLLTGLAEGRAAAADVPRLEAVSQAMQRASLCGLGQTAPNPVLSSLRYFADEFREHIESRRCRALKCRGLVRYAIDPQKCVGCTACARVCPASCIAGERRKTHAIDPARCVACGQCYEVCKFGAVQRS